jgi:hypothetical protein
VADSALQPNTQATSTRDRVNMQLLEEIRRLTGSYWQPLMQVPIPKGIRVCQILLAKRLTLDEHPSVPSSWKSWTKIEIIPIIASYEKCPWLERDGDSLVLSGVGGKVLPRQANE